MGLRSAQPPAPSTAVANRTTEIKFRGLVHCRSYKHYHAYQQRTSHGLRADFVAPSNRFRESISDMPRERLARGHSDKMRKSYTLKFKHDVINEYQPGVTGKGLAAIAKKYGGVSTGTIRGWYKNREEIARALQNRDEQTRANRRISGGGRGVKYQDVVKEWVLEQRQRSSRQGPVYLCQGSARVKGAASR
jgi:transposase-like protein